LNVSCSDAEEKASGIWRGVVSRDGPWQPTGAIFCDDGDREVFLKTLGEASERCGWRVHCYVLLLEISAADLPKQPKGSAEKIALASVARQRTSVTRGSQSV
jgi:hypothetical protein